MKVQWQVRCGGYDGGKRLANYRLTEPVRQISAY